MPKPAAADKLKQFFQEVGDLSDLSLRAVPGVFSKPFYYRECAAQMDKIGVGSLFSVLLTGLFSPAFSPTWSWRCRPCLS